MNQHISQPQQRAAVSFARVFFAFTVASLVAFLAFGILVAIGAVEYSYITINDTTMYYIPLSASLIVIGIPAWCIVFGLFAAIILAG
jgi:hypothetical protein